MSRYYWGHIAAVKTGRSLQICLLPHCSPCTAFPLAHPHYCFLSPLTTISWHYLGTCLATPLQGSTNMMRVWRITRAVPSDPLLPVVSASRMVTLDATFSLSPPNLIIRPLVTYCCSGSPKILILGSIWWFLYSSSEGASCNWMLPGFLVCFNIFIIEFLLKIFVRCIFILCCGSAQPNVPRRIPCYLALLPGDKIGFPGLRPAWQLLGPRLLLLTSKLLLLFATHNYATCNTSGSKLNVLNQQVLMNAKNE